MAADQPDYTDAVFGNDLIFDHFIEFLGIPDLKILRQTCKFLYSKVNGSRKFISSVRLTISDETIRENGTCDAIAWKNASIVVSRTSSQHFRNIQTDCIEDLEVLHPTSEDLAQLKNDENSRLAYYELLEVKKFPNLRSMTLHMNLMCYDIPMAAMASVAGTVKEFRFQGVGMYKFDPYPEDEEGRSTAKNLEMIGGLPWKLHSFVIEGCRLSPLISLAVGAIPASSASTLQKLKLCSAQFGRESHIHGVRFLQLKTIELEIGMDECDEYDGTPLVEFLNLQPQLEAIEIDCDKLYRSQMRNFLLNSPPELHTLRLLGDVWLNSFPDFQSWAFIGDLTALKNLMICGGFITSDDNVAAEILNCLPSRIHSLELQHVKFDIVGHSGTIAALTGFPNLVQLKLSAHLGLNCASLINDALLQTICRSLIKLRVLHFGSTEITDFGLTGERGNHNSGVSLRNLEGLQDLNVSRCIRITENGILKAIEFSELRKLGLWKHISKSAIIEIASHNPSLEYVACYLDIRNGDVPFTEYLRELFSSIMAVNPRLTRIHMEHISLRTEGDLPDAVIGRPSYGVSANLANTTTLSHVRNTMKIVKSTKGEVSPYRYNCTFYYNMPK